jgi:hypothetical protein
MMTTLNASIQTQKSHPIPSAASSAGATPLSDQALFQQVVQSPQPETVIKKQFAKQTPEQRNNSANNFVKAAGRDGINKLAETPNGQHALAMIYDQTSGESRQFMEDVHQEQGGTAVDYTHTNHENSPKTINSHPPLGLIPTSRNLQQTTPPAEVVDRVEALFSAVTDQTEIVLDTIIRDGFGEWVDIFSERFRATDAADAGQRLNAAVHSVLDDVRTGQLTPADFGTKNWQGITTTAFLNLAKQRLQSGNFDIAAATSQMHKDELWKSNPIQLPTTGELKPLDDTHTGNLMNRSIVSLVMPNKIAAKIFDWPLGQRAIQNAERIAAASPAQREQMSREAALDTAFALYNGIGIEPTAQAVLPAILNLTEISPFYDIAPAPTGATEKFFEEQIEAGQIDGFTQTKQGLMTYRLKTPQHIAEQVAAKYQLGMLDHLSKSARNQLSSLLFSTHKAHGETLAERLESEGQWSKYRQLISDGVDIGAVAFISGGVGGFFETAAVGARVSSLGIKSTRFLATSTSFTTMMGAKTGDFSPGAYTRDMLMFGILGQTAKISSALTRSIPGSTITAQSLRFATAHGASVTTAAAATTLAQATERGLKEGDPKWTKCLGDFKDNLVVVGIVHGTNSALAKINPNHFAPGGPTKAELQRLSENHTKVMQETDRALKQISTALEQGDVVTAKQGVEMLKSAKQNALAVSDDLSHFAHHSISTKVGQQVDKEITKAKQILSGEPKLTRRVEKQEAIVNDIGQEGMSNLTNEIGAIKVEHLHDQMPKGIVGELSNNAAKHKPLAETLAEIPPDQVAVVERLAKKKQPEKVLQALTKGDPKRFLEGAANAERTKATHQAESQARVDNLVKAAKETGFLERGDVKKAFTITKPDIAIRGYLGEHIAQLEAKKSYPVSEGYEVLGGVKVFELLPGIELDPNEKLPDVNDINFYKLVTDIDTLVLKKGGVDEKDQVVYLEQQKTGAQDTPGRAKEQNENALQALADLASNNRYGGIRLEYKNDKGKGVEITHDLDAASAASAKALTRGPAGKAFNLDMGATNSELVKAAKKLYAEGKKEMTP